MNDGVKTPATPATTRILWRGADPESVERFTSGPTVDGWRFDGLVVLPVDDEPAQISYSVETDPSWRTRLAHVVIDRHGQSRQVTVDADGEGAWVVDGTKTDALAGCIDVDLAFTPATNTLSIRRLTHATAPEPIPVGETRTLQVAWLSFPEFEIMRNEQSYTRLAPDRWQFRSGTFVADLAVDPDGYVLRYGDDGLWTAVLHRTG